MAAIQTPAWQLDFCESLEMNNLEEEPVKAVWSESWR
jgi:hypothetical protein